MFQLFFVALAVVAASIHLAVSRKRRDSGSAIAGTYLIYLFVIYVGLMGVLTAYAHVFRPVQTSASIGWSTSPYEYEVGMADLTVGVLGILCIWFRETSGWLLRLPMRFGYWETRRGMSGRSASTTIMPPTTQASFSMPRS
jgi:hypothetical protein